MAEGMNGWMEGRERRCQGGEAMCSVWPLLDRRALLGNDRSCRKLPGRKSKNAGGASKRGCPKQRSREAASLNPSLRRLRETHPGQ